MPTKRHFGLIRQTPIAGERKLFLPHTVTDALPSEFILPDFDKVPQQDQGAEGSCGPNTFDECAMYDQLQQGQPIVPVARNFVYYNTRVLMGTINQDSGVDNRTMMQAVSKVGYCDESDWPYSDQHARMVQQPSQACYTNALRNRLNNFIGVIIGLAQLKAALYSNKRAILFGFEVFQQIESDQASNTGVLTVPGAHESAIGGHDVPIIGWSDARKAFLFRNHWMNGPNHPWGDPQHPGCGWIPYDYAANPNLASDCWIVPTVAGGIITPPLPLPPTPPSPPSPLPSPTTNIAISALIAKTLGCSVDQPSVVGKSYQLGIN